MKIQIHFLLSYISVLSCVVPNLSANPLDVISKSKDPLLKPVFEDLEKYQVQILYTEVMRSRDGTLEALNTFQFNVDPKRYFYPASTVKLPAAILATEATHLGAFGESMALESEYSLTGEYLNEIYPDSDEHFSSIARDVELIAVVSDNMAYNRLYDLLGPDSMEVRLKELGLTRPRLSHRLAISLSRDLNRTRVGFAFPKSAPTFSFPGEKMAIREYNPEVFLGKGYISRGQLVEDPFPVHARNFIGLDVLHNSLLGLVLGKESTEVPQFKINEQQRSWLIEVFSKLPRECNLLSDTQRQYPDNYAKFLIFGDQPNAVISDDIQIVNKIGQAYGFLSDVAYVKNENLGVEFALSAVIFVNENLIFNDNDYEYETIGFPFLGELGRTVYALNIDK